MHERRGQSLVAMDELRVATYLGTQAEDWKLLFGTAGRRLRIIRTVQERALRWL